LVDGLTKFAFRSSTGAMLETADIAVVSFDKFIHGSDDDRRVVAKQLYDAFSTVGWVYLKDHGIAQERVDEMFSLVR
jgi:isopenicillin N synthase-like dioxygenase